MQRQRYYVKYGNNDIIVPMSLVRMSGYPTMSGQWKEIFSICCDPDYSPYLSYEREKAFVQLNKQGEPFAGPVIRKNKPKNGRFIQIPYNICCSVSDLVQIVIQPQDQTVDEGDTATFTVVATGLNLTYQWQLNGSDIVGATSSSYTTPATVDTDDGNEYTVIISNQFGEVTSEVAVLTVTPAP